MKSWTDRRTRGERLAVALCVVACHAAVLLAVTRPTFGRGGEGLAPRHTGAQSRPGLVTVQVTSAKSAAQPAADSQPGGAFRRPDPPPSASGLPESTPYVAEVELESHPFSERDGLVYVPRRWLDTPPGLVSPVNLSFPLVEGYVDLTLDVALLIDSSGQVRHVVVRTPEVHEEFVRAVTEAFLQGRFTPGEIDGVPVPSEVRIQVEFKA